MFVCFGMGAENSGGSFLSGQSSHGTGFKASNFAAFFLSASTSYHSTKLTYKIIKYLRRRRTADRLTSYRRLISSFCRRILLIFSSRAIEAISQKFIELNNDEILVISRIKLKKILTVIFWNRIQPEISLPVRRVFFDKIVTSQ